MTVKFNLLRPTDKTGKLKSEPVSITITVNNKGTRKGPFATGYSVIPKFWDKKEREVKASMIGAQELNDRLEAIKKRIIQKWESDKSVSGVALGRLAQEAIEGESQPTQQKKSLLELVQKFIVQYSLEKDKQTVTKYNTLKKHLTNYLEKHPVGYDQLDHNFYDSFKKYLYGIPNPNHRGCDLVFDAGDNCYHIRPCDDGVLPVNPVGLFDDIVFNHIRNLKVILKWAEKRDYPIHKAYKDWQIIKRDYDPLYLTQDELERLENVELPKHLDIARDYLLLECRTGQRISDLKRFSRSDIQGDVWTFKQKKGSRLLNKTITLPLVGYCAPALDILQKYNYELPRLSEAKINRYIKVLCERSGISDDIEIERWAANKRVKISGKKHEFISTHTGRKTFITLTLQDPGFTAKMVMDIAGIRSFKTLNHYNGKSEIVNIRKALEGMAPMKVLRKAN